MRLEVVARSRVVGFHRWPEAPDKFAYLRDRHRHEFVIDARAYVGSPDREIEVNDLKQRMEAYLFEQYGSPCEFGNMACEHIAAQLIDVFGLSSCQVLEDGLNGAVATR